MNNEFKPVSLPLAVMFSGVFALLLFCHACQGRADSLPDTCLDPWWEIPRGTYIDRFCPGYDDRESCIEETFRYSPETGQLSIHYLRDGFGFSLTIKNICSYAVAGFDIHPVIFGNNSESPKLILYAVVPGNNDYMIYADPFKSKMFGGYKDTYKSLRAIPRSLYLAMRGTRIGMSCNFYYYPHSDFLIGSCKNRENIRETVFIGAVTLIAQELEERSRDKLIIENVDGRLKLKNCPDPGLPSACQIESFPEEKARNACAVRGLYSVKIGDFIFCHDRQYSEESIEIRGCEIQALAVDPEKGLLIAQCQQGFIRYLLNPGVCLNAGLTLSRLKNEGVLLSCELAIAAGTPEGFIMDQADTVPVMTNNNASPAIRIQSESFQNRGEL